MPLSSTTLVQKRSVVYFSIFLCVLLGTMLLQIWLAFVTNLSEQEALYMLASAGGLDILTQPFFSKWMAHVALFLSPFLNLESDFLLRLLSILGYALLSLSIYYLTRKIFPVARGFVPLLASLLFMLTWAAQYTALFGMTASWVALNALWASYFLLVGTERHGIFGWMMVFALLVLLVLQSYEGMIFLVALVFLGFCRSFRVLNQRLYYWIYAASGVIFLLLLSGYILFSNHFFIVRAFGLMWGQFATSPWVLLDRLLLKGALGLWSLGFLGLVLSFGGFWVHRSEVNTRFLYLLSFLSALLSLPFLLGLLGQGFALLGGVVLLSVLAKFLSHRFVPFVSSILILGGGIASSVFFFVYLSGGLYLSFGLDPTKEVYWWRQVATQARMLSSEHNLSQIVIDDARYSARLSWYTSGAPSDSLVVIDRHQEENVWSLSIQQSEPRARLQSGARVLFVQTQIPYQTPKSIDGSLFEDCTLLHRTQMMRPSKTVGGDALDLSSFRIQFFDCKSL